MLTPWAGKFSLSIRFFFARSHPYIYILAMLVNGMERQEETRQILLTKEERVLALNLFLQAQIRGMDSHAVSKLIDKFKNGN